MAKGYRLEVINDNLISDYKLPRVRVIMDYANTDFHEQHYINTFADLSEDKQIIPQMVTWCEENECGYRTSYDTFKFRNADQLTMFILRWS